MSKRKTYQGLGTGFASEGDSYPLGLARGSLPGSGSLKVAVVEPRLPVVGFAELGFVSEKMKFRIKFLTFLYLL